ncbi:MAG TPA: tetratricopeptide repeat protein [Dongiaceae bacterium]|nr:tetratricopeptide repeat protein [Dongiaceae bacterium]
MAIERKCPDCGSPIPAGAPAGFCPRCEMAGAIELAPPSEAAPAAVKTLRYFGDYELLEEIARGGMGVVYKARQVSLGRVVAVKLILAGRLATAAEVDRFRAEARAAAGLQHANIVPIYEIGDQDGQNYFSMEFVDGPSLAQVVRESPLPAGRAAGYVRTVAEAIQYAHESGVLHRDLKPSNVLIDPFDQPRVTDFGLARNLAGDSGLTETGQVLGAPSFIPPEQAAGRKQDVGRHSDVYALGAILYHLLTGRPPFAAETLAATLAQVLNNEPAAPRSLNASIPRDLETICLKCLEKDPHRRYLTAKDFADELGRLHRGEPIQARPAGRGEKVWRWCWRNPALAGSLATAALLLLAGTAASTWQAVRATRAEREQVRLRDIAVAAEKTAKSEAIKRWQMSNLLQPMLKGVGPSAAKGRDTKMLREILDQTAARVGQELKDQPDVEAEFRSTIGSVYLSLAEYDKAEAMFSAALALRKKSNPESLLVAESLNDLANVFYRQGKLANAETMHREALALRRRLLGNKHVQIANSLGNLANVLRDQSKLPEAEKMQREALAMRTELLGTNSDDTAMSLVNLAGVLSLEGKLKEGEAMQREALEVTKRALGNDDPAVAISLNDLADMLLAEGKLSEAEATNRVALALRIKLFGNEHPDVAFSLFNLANVLAAEGRLPEAEAMHRRTLAMRKKLLGNEHPDVAGSLNNLAGILIQENKFREAEAAQREALAIQRKLLPAEHEDIAGSLVNLASVLWCQGRSSEAEATFREALAMQRKLLGDAHPEVAMTLHNLASVLQSETNFPGAEAMFRESLAMRTKLLGNEHPDVAVSLNSLASVVQELGRLPEAEALLREALAMRKKLLGAEHPAVAESLGDLAGVLERQGKLPDAETAGREALALREKILPGDWLTFDARCRLGGVLVDRKSFAAAEPLLLSGYAGMKDHEAMIPIPNRSRLTEAIQSIVRLYEATGRPDRAAEWKKRGGQ